MVEEMVINANACTQWMQWLFIPSYSLICIRRCWFAEWIRRNNAEGLLECGDWSGETSRAKIRWGTAKLCFLGVGACALPKTAI